MTAGIAHEFARVLKRTDFVARHYRAVLFKKDKRAETVDAIPHWAEYRQRAKAMKARVRADLDDLVARFRERAEARGATVFEASTAAEANDYVLSVARTHRAASLVKSKSMTTEECGLNPFLEAKGMTVTDTDLGERIVQLFGEPPSHIVTPAIHRSREEIGALFAEHGLCEPGETDPTRLTLAARKSLRSLFLGADVGLTGANFLVAETGTAVVIENEANSLLGTSLPRVHVVVAGIEKLVERLDDLAVFLTLLAPSSTGQRLTTYTTHYSGPQPATPAETALGLSDHELHIVLIDNGRRDLVATPAAEALACIRCGACLNVCPVYRRVGGHAYAWVYPGPIGVVLGPGLGGPDQRELVKASSLCSACNDVCPVGIDLSGHIHDWRGRLRSAGRLARGVPRGIGWLLRHPRLWHAGIAAAKRSGSLFARSRWVKAFAAGGRRRLPELPAQSFRAWLRTHQPTGVRLDAPKALAEAPQPAPPAAPNDLDAVFREALEEAGGTVCDLDALPAEAVATSAARAALRALGIDRPLAPADKQSLDGQPWLVATARWRIARTGSCWVDFGDLDSRAQLLLAEGLVLLVPGGEIAPDLPEHYERLGASDLTSCGSIVTGPSKTADIELTLVFGAHGPRRMLVIPT